MRECKQNLPLFLYLLIRNYVPLDQFNAFETKFGVNFKKKKLDNGGSILSSSITPLQSYEIESLKTFISSMHGLLGVTILPLHGTNNNLSPFLPI
jgi:hypothetical protein